MTTDRIISEHSLHAVEKPLLCPDGKHAHWRTISCCKVAPDTDVIECSRCGKQLWTTCDFDEEYS